MRRPVAIVLVVFATLVLSGPISMLVGGFRERANVRLIAAHDSNVNFLSNTLARAPSGSFDIKESLTDWPYRSLFPVDFRPRSGRVHHWNREGLPYYWIFLLEHEGTFKESWMAIPPLFPWGSMKIEKLQKVQTDPNQ